MLTSMNRKSLGKKMRAKTMTMIYSTGSLLFKFRMAVYFPFQSSDEEEQINSRSNKSKADGRKGRLYESDSEEEEEGEFRPAERILEIKGNKSSMSYAPKVKKAPEVFEQVMLDFESI